MLLLVVGWCSNVADQQGKVQLSGLPEGTSKVVGSTQSGQVAVFKTAECRATTSKQHLLKYVWGFGISLGMTIPMRSAEIALLSCHHHYRASKVARIQVMLVRLWNSFASCRATGGVKYIKPKNVEFTLLLAMSIPSIIPDSTESLQLTPPKVGEHGCGAIKTM